MRNCGFVPHRVAAEDRLAHTLAAAPTCLAGARGETDDKLARTVIVLPDFSKLSEARSNGFARLARDQFRMILGVWLCHLCSWMNQLFYIKPAG